MWNEVEDVRIEIPSIRLDKAFNPEIIISDRYIGKELPITYRGSGIQRYLILAMLEIYRKLKIGKDYVLLFEEPEIYLHVGAQKKMCAILKNFSEKGKVVISTHSNIFVDKSDFSSTYLLTKEYGETKERRFEGDKEILDELGLSPSDLFLTSGIILVEGGSDFEIVKTFAEAIFNYWDEYNIAIIPIGGSNIEHQDPATLLSINPNIAVVLDSDVKAQYSNLPANKEQLKQKFEEAEIPVYFWKRDGQLVRSIENLFPKDCVEEALNINLEPVLSPYEDVPFTLGKKLAEIRVQKDPNVGSENLDDDEFCKEEYKKVKHGRKIAKKIVEEGSIPSNVRETLNRVIEGFNFEISSN